MTELEAFGWQKAAIEEIPARLASEARSALIQLPTGMGKSLIAVRTFEALRQRYPGSRLVIVVPSRHLSAGWRRALGYDVDSKIVWHEWIRPPCRRWKIRFETRIRLTQAVLKPRPGRPPNLATQINTGKTLVVLDEIHQYRGILEAAATVFAESASTNARVAEQVFTRPFRSPTRGKRQWPKWVLLSATPVNPVHLDKVDPLDAKPADAIRSVPETDDESAFADELELTLGALAGLGGLRFEPWFTNHITTARELLTAAQPSVKPLVPPDKLIVWPKNVRGSDFRPPKEKRWTPAPGEPKDATLERSLRQVVLVAGTVVPKAKGVPERRTAMERFVLSGGAMDVSGRLIENFDYTLSLASGVQAASLDLEKSGYKIPEKLNALVDFVKLRARGQHVLIFCVHRAVAARVASTVAVAVGEKTSGERVRAAIGEIRDCDIKWFNLPLDGTTRVLVATDAFSESIGLHESANILVHYELPWSPLRALQRTGRLWRIREKEKRGGHVLRPKLPGVVHFAHPGSTDEEILARLRRRWGHLAALGLDFLSFVEAMGPRLPAVPPKWTGG